MIFSKEQQSKIKKLHDSMKDSDALAKLAYEFGQIANYFDRANSAHSRKELGREDEVKYKEFLRKGIQVKAQLQKEIEGMQKGMKAGQEIGYFESYDNKTLGLLLDAISRLDWTSREMQDITGKKIAKELDDLYDKYKKLIIDGKRRFDSKPKDSKVKDAQIELDFYSEEETLAGAKKDAMNFAKQNGCKLIKFKDLGNTYSAVFEGTEKNLKKLLNDGGYDEEDYEDFKIKDNKVKDSSVAAELEHYINEMRSIAEEVRSLKLRYSDNQKKFNTLRMQINLSKDPEDLSALKEFVKQKQGLDRVVFNI